MDTSALTGVVFVDADAGWQERLVCDWPRVQPHHFRQDPDGFGIIALADEQPVGLIAVWLQSLPQPASALTEAFVENIEVAMRWRRCGVGRRLVELACERAKACGAGQLRAWSSQDKLAAIGLWRSLGFALCPAAEYAGGREIRGFLVARRLPGHPAWPEGVQR